MNRTLGIGLMAAALAFASAPRFRIDFSRVGPKSRKTGKTYPHSNTRQRARYARQALCAG